VRVFILGLVIGVALGAFGPSLARTIATPTPSPTPKAAIAAGSAAVAPQVSTIERALAQARQSGKAVPVTVTFSDADLTSAVGLYFPQTLSGATLSDPAVHLRAGQIVLDMTAAAAFVRTTATVIASVGVQNGHPDAAVVSATIGGVALPQSVSDQIAAQLDQALSAALPAKLVISSVTATSGLLTVVGVANP
jgi:hypothetical protein